MPSEKSSIVTVRFTPEFKRNLRTLSKKYRHIRSDVEPVISGIQAGEIPGEQIPHTGYTVFKVKVKNSDSSKGKRSGYRFIYYLKTPTEVILVTIYSKSKQSDVAVDQIQRILQEYDNRQEME